VKVVVDTNVFVSGAFFFGPPYEILSACEAGVLQLVLSLDILAEYRRIGLGFLRTRSEVDYERLLDMHQANAVVVTASRLGRSVCRDPDDDKFLACAIAGNARIVVSGDKDLLATSGYAGITVLTPRKFVEQYLRSRS
jgi:uncharacterized protein